MRLQLWVYYRCLYHEDGHRQKLQCTHYNSINSNHMFVTRGIFNCTSGLANFYTSVQVYFVKFTFKIHFRNIYLICTKIIFVNIKQNWTYCLRESLQWYRTIIGNTYIQMLLVFHISIYRKGKRVVI